MERRRRNDRTAASEAGEGHSPGALGDHWSPGLTVRTARSPHQLAEFAKSSGISPTSLAIHTLLGASGLPPCGLLDADNLPSVVLTGRRRGSAASTGSRPGVDGQDLLAVEIEAPLVVRRPAVAAR